MLKLYHLWRRKSLYEIHYHLQIDNVRELGVKSAGSLPIRKAYQNMTKINESPNRAGKKVYLTAQGLVDAKAELEFFKNTKRAQVAELIHQAREYGDLAENSEYDAALEEQAMIESRISELENILKGAKVIS
ncbi:MAG: hypothetical protein Q8P87_00360, partial [bacterium]|nr:hypothetical protein [bacterium]